MELKKWDRVWVSDESVQDALEGKFERTFDWMYENKYLVNSNMSYYQIWNYAVKVEEEQEAPSQAPYLTTEDILWLKDFISKNK